MSTAIVTPSIIQGPAYISVNGQVLYVQKDIAVSDAPESWNPESSFGKLGERHKSRKAVLTFTPVGMVSATLLNVFYAAFMDPTKIGRSIIGGTSTVIISSITENKTYTWVRGGMTKAPGLMLKPTATAFGGMEVTCIGAAATTPLDPAWWKAASGAVVADASFDDTKIISDIYSAALGVRMAPYNALGGQDGFEVDFGYEVVEVPNGDVGIADIILASLSTGVKFAPSNLTEAQVDVLLGLQDTTATLPGQAYGRGVAGTREAMVITGTQVGWVFQLKAQGAKGSTKGYAIGQHRFKELTMVNELTFAAGVPSAMFAFTAPS